MIVRYDDAVWSITRDQVLAMLAAPGMNRPKVIAEIKNSLGGFLDVPPTLITQRVMMEALQTGEITLLELIRGDDE